MGAIGKRDAQPSQFWHDSADFVPEHDELMVEFYNRRLEVIEILHSKGWLCEGGCERPSFFKIHTFTLEPHLYGATQLFPDALAEGVGHPDAAYLATIIFELKPHIYSLGSVIRQLGLYKEAREEPKRKGTWFGPPIADYVCLITPDTRYDDVFIEQGFPVVHL